MLKSNLRSKTSKSFTQRPKIRNQNLKIDPPGYLPVARKKDIQTWYRTDATEPSSCHSRRWAEVSVRIIGQQGSSIF